MSNVRLHYATDKLNFFYQCSTGPSSTLFAAVAFLGLLAHFRPSGHRPGHNCNSSPDPSERLRSAVRRHCRALASTFPRGGGTAISATALCYPASGGCVCFIHRGAVVYLSLSSELGAFQNLLARDLY